MEEELEILEDVSPIGLKRSRDSAVDIGADNDDNATKKYKVRKDDIFVKIEDIRREGVLIHNNSVDWFLRPCASGYTIFEIIGI